ncbi:MAG TPA: HAMP domain-containing sensor histidine kinase [Steroidobacteraceae bacterium]|jgi:two-component system sensor histidine kinase GlrK|nr:HAMP domain-containing sensor histidine kinase [Steroidobacteraceae bacterium]
MGWLLPKSLNGFLLLGLGFLAGPLLLAILHAAVQMRRLSDTSQQLVVDSVQSTRLTQDMYAQIALLERSARLYQVLGEPTVRASFREHDARLSEIVGTLRQRLRAADAPGQWQRLIDTQQHIEALVLPAPVAAGQAAELAQSFVLLGDLANGVANLTDQQIDAESRDLRARTDQAQRELFLESTLLLPLIVIVVLLFALRLSRPLRQIDRAIGELGRGNFSNSIVINGPVDLERLGHQLEWLRNRLLELAQERNRFLRHLSHELKTPLANIREGTELLMDGAVGELESGQREVTAILRDNGIKLQRLIENLLSFSAWQSNSTGLDVTEFRLRPVVKQVLENQQLTLVSQRVRLDVRVEDVTLVADRGKIRLILENLLSNAIKYSPRGGVIYLRASTSGEQLVLEVGDSGPGIPHEDRARIFDAFYTGRAPGGHVRGTGIGLSVVNEFVNVHHGTVEIVDGEVPGAHFRIRMPLRVAPLEAVKRQADAA